MIKFYYYLYHSYITEYDKEGEPVYERKSIGYFSALKLVKTQIDSYIKLPGFKDHPVDCFQIHKVGCSYESSNICKHKAIINELSHEYSDEDGYDFPTIFGIYSTKEAAKVVMNEQLKRKPYKYYPDNFIIDSIVVDGKPEWSEGFVPFDE